MKKTLFAVATLLAANVAHASCDYTPDKEGFNYSFTAYGAKDKSYVVTQNTFKTYELASESGKLLGATIEIDATSLDTSKDMNNGGGGLWPENLAQVRNGNVVNGLFNNFANPGKISGKISAIDKAAVSLDLTMNGETRTISMPYSIAEGSLSAKGTLDILDFNAADAFKMFSNICRSWHKGKSWSDVDIMFSVPVKENGCG
ncbi:YceI family protein [Neptuniibacter sp. SY11_33]|uniref:YceI family protein n=1 Tax=Neptuniibacter sp. SY11_33 TaxID=3398215 RepID=UPI0039F49DE7